MSGMDSKLRANVETKLVDSPDFAYEDGLQPQKGSTQNDVLDMSRMGKRQELQVGRGQRPTRTLLLINCAEELQILVHCRLHHDPPVLVGEHLTVSGAYKWDVQRLNG